MESGGGDTGGIFQIKKSTDFAGALARIFAENSCCRNAWRSLATTQ